MPARNFDIEKEREKFTPPQGCMHETVWEDGKLKICLNCGKIIGKMEKNDKP